MLRELQAASEGLDHSGWSGLAGGLLRLGDRDPGCRRPDRRRRACQPGRTRRPGAGAVPSGGHDGLAGSVKLPEWAQAGGIHHCRVLQLGVGSGLGYRHSRVWPPASTFSSPRPRLAIGSRIRAFIADTLERAGFSAHDAVFIGDSLRTDVLGPQRVGIPSVLVGRASHAARPLTSRSASLAEAAGSPARHEAAGRARVTSCDSVSGPPPAGAPA